MNNPGLPPLPPIGSVGLDVCNVIQLYMAIWDDLTPEEVRVVSAHVHVCADCAHEQRVFMRSSQKVANLDASSPSPRVDQAVMMAIAARAKTTNKVATKSAKPVQPVPLVTPIKKRTRKSSALPLRLGGLVAAAAVMFVGLFAASHYIMPIGGSANPIVASQPGHVPNASLQTFALPANLTWNGFVLYHSQTMMSDSGQQFKVETYQDLASGRMNIETVMGNDLDVVLVGDAHETLGMDMMHRVAQWDAKGWQLDGSMFDLNQLRQQLKNGQVVYQGKTTFQGQPVYSIKYPDNKILLLNMDYMPVNVLEQSAGAQAAAPMYTKVQVLPSSKVPESTWSMNVPQGFKLGKLPKKPVEVNS
jgi:hypothetical protein